MQRQRELFPLNESYAELVREQLRYEPETGLVFNHFGQLLPARTPPASSPCKTELIYYWGNVRSYNQLIRICLGYDQYVCTHHINRDPTDHRRENLCYLPMSAHTHLHNAERSSLKHRRLAIEFREVDRTQAFRHLAQAIAHRRKSLTIERFWLDLNERLTVPELNQLVEHGPPEWAIYPFTDAEHHLRSYRIERQQQQYSDAQFG